MYLFEILDIEIQTVLQAEFLTRRICDRESTRFTLKKENVCLRDPRTFKRTPPSKGPTSQLEGIFRS